ncbi:MAG TPA: recombinase RecT [Patescibacteria group bacterium]|nr:recombinase RecT [Patescibacteria group bacterium]
MTRELSNPEMFNALLVTTFKGLTKDNMKLAIVDGMIRGFTFKDFRERNVYAIPYGSNYSLVTSIDHARKIGMKSGVVGKSEPIFEEKEGKLFSCSITIKRRVGSDIGEFVSKVYFDEYSTGKNLWVTKPRTMIAKVAEMHALRMACPEELAQAYTEEEIERESKPATVVPDITEYKAKLEAATTLDELKNAWAALPAEAKKELADLKESLKKKFENELPNVNEDPDLSAN